MKTQTLIMKETVILIYSLCLCLSRVKDCAKIGPAPKIPLLVVLRYFASIELQK